MLADSVTINQSIELRAIFGNKLIQDLAVRLAFLLHVRNANLSGLTDRTNAGRRHHAIHTQMTTAIAVEHPGDVIDIGTLVLGGALGQAQRRGQDH